MSRSPIPRVTVWTNVTGAPGRAFRAAILTGAAALLTTATALLPARALAVDWRSYRVQVQGSMDALLAAGVPGIVVYARDGNRTLTLARGLRDTSAGLPMKRGNRFRVGSITKTFVAATLLRLESEGRLDLDDPVAHWLPGAIPNGGDISLRQLLNQTSGLFNYTDDLPFYVSVLTHPLQKWTPQELLAIANSHPPTSPPGTKHSYSNTNYIVAGLVLEAVAGKPIAEALRDTFKVARLHHTTFEEDSIIDGPFAHGYFYGVDVNVFDPAWVWAAGAISSDAKDIARFFRALLGGRLLADTQLQEMETLVPVGFAEDPAAGYGLGLRGETHTFFSEGRPHVTCGPGAWGHSGNYFGYQSLAINSRDGVRQVVILMTYDALFFWPAQLEHLVEDAWCPLFS